MNHRYYFIGVILLIITLLIPFQIYKIRQRRLAERLNAGHHSEKEDHDCCGCH